MTKGKRTCKILKEIRQQIADNNEIEYVTSECHFQGECKGTCPKCESEVRYLENELNKRRQLGKVVTIAGISLGVAGSFSACNSAKQNELPVSEMDTLTEISVQTVNLDSFDTNISSIPSMQGNFIVEVIGDVEAEPISEFTIIAGEMESQDNTIDTIIPIEHYEDEEVPIMGFIQETMPEFPGGEQELMKFLQKNLVFPKEAVEKGIEGRVVVGFTVEIDGSISNVKILRGKDSDLDKEAIRVVKLMPKWKPGEQRGKKVRIQCNLPIDFYFR
jgi:TonB family protein